MTKVSILPAVETLEQFDCAHTPGAPKAQLQELAHLALVQHAENVVLLGPSGVGRTLMALALGHRALEEDDDGDGQREPFVKPGLRRLDVVAERVVSAIPAAPDVVHGLIDAATMSSAVHMSPR